MNFAYVALRELEQDKGLVYQLLYFFGNAKDHGFIFQRAREMKKETDMSTYVEIGKRRKKQWPKLKAREGGLFYLVSLDQTSYPVCTKFFSTQRKTAQTKVQYIYKV